jgi:hypothetical protein
VLDLLHHPPVRLVDAVGGLGDQAVQAGPLELAEPAGGHLPVGGRLGQVNGRARPGQGALERGPALGERPLHVVDVAQREQVERHEVPRRLGRQQLDPAGRGVDPQL